MKRLSLCIVFVGLLFVCICYAVQFQSQNLVIYGDRFENAGQFMKSAIVVQRLWVEYSNAVMENPNRCGVRYIRNAQRSVIPNVTDSIFVKELVEKTFPGYANRIIVLSTEDMKIDSNGVAFVGIENIKSLDRWFRTGKMEK